MHLLPHEPMCTAPSSSTVSRALLSACASAHTSLELHQEAVELMAEGSSMRCLWCNCRCSS